MSTSSKPKPSRRALIAFGVFVLWGAGLALLTRRELFRPRLDRLAEVGLRMNQYTSFYGLRANGELVGYGSSIVDTTPTEITVTDFMVRELSPRRPRWSKRAKVTLSRTFKLKSFESGIVTQTVNLKTTGRVEGDSMIFTLSSNNKPPTTSVIKLDGPVLLPNMVQHAVMLMETPRVGRKYTIPVFDPSTQSVVQVKSEIVRDTTFVLSDSSVLDTASRVWASMRTTPLKAWLVSSSPGGFNGWLDETGHIVRTEELDGELTRSTIEESFENWMIGVYRRRRAAGMLPPEPDPAPTKPRKSP